ncbi:MAG TPA: CoA transferase [Acidimicrobiia bacterium]|jgi:crotonobetainyl-CoA:carnitine CoA-transferase CaiB-like acyl-CoA transferase
MTEALLAGIRVVDLAGEPAAMAGRILADLGAEVILVEPRDGHPLRALPRRFLAWGAGKASVAVDGPEDPRLAELLATADAVIETPGFPGAFDLDPARASHAVWARVTPFGGTGPHGGWRASDLGVMAVSGNMYATGDPDRPPVRCSEPAGYAHVGAETAYAVLTALASCYPHRIDISMQEVVFVANMVGLASFPKTGHRGARRGANIGRTREIWPCKNGWVSFGLRGGKARVPSLTTLTRLIAAEDGIDAGALTGRDWTEFSQNTAGDDELKAIEQPVAEYFARHTMQELYEIACETNLMLAPCNSPREIYASAQLEAREFFGPVGDIARFPRSFVIVSSRDGEVAPARATAGAPAIGSADAATGRKPASGAGFATQPAGARAAWDGTNILEFGSGAAGPIATRYFVEHGATVLRVESRSRPDFLRVYALAPDNPHGLEGAPMFDGLNVGKRSVTLNLKHPGGVDIAKRIVGEWADAVVENFAPRAMRGFGLDYDTLAAVKPELVMVSSCLQGQTGPHRDYPGFGGQGAALSGFNWLTGWPDREPLGPYGTITDSLAPRFVASALAAGLLYRRRTGRGAYFDLAQVEAGSYSLSPWLLDYEHDGTIGSRMGNRSPRAVPHGAFACLGDDRWVAIACWTDDEWGRLSGFLGFDDPSLATLAARLERIDDVEAAVEAWTATRTREEIADVLQAAGIEAVPVYDFGDVHDDPQIEHREHFVPLTHPYMGDGLYERTGTRVGDTPHGYDRPGPTLGQDNDWVLGELLGLPADERKRLEADGALD